MPRVNPSQSHSPYSLLECTAVLILGAIAFVAWALYAGRDLNWDFLNYHLYLGLHADGKGLAKNFFPAGGSSYLNPYAYWPLGAMISAKWPAMAVGAVLALIQSLAVISTWYLSRQLFPDASLKAAYLRVVATIIGVICPVVLTEVGSSFIDINTAVFVLLGIALLIRAADHTQSTRTFALSGMCFGIATALKLTNAPYALAGLLSVAFMWIFRPGVNWKTLLVFGFCQAVGLLIAHGAWGFSLWREFGNPFFPFFNFVFSAGSPITAANHDSTFQLVDVWNRVTNWRAGLQQRFLPMTFWDWLLRPLYMLDPVANVYTEVRSPDARFLALFCLAPFALWKLRMQFRTSNLVALLLYFSIAWIIWLAVFGNGRYLIPLMLAVGPALVGCASVVWERVNRVALAAITIFLCVQAALMWEGAMYRWEEVSWQRHWIDAELPRGLSDHPVTFVSFDLQSISWLTAFVHPESQIVNPIGLSAVPAGSAISGNFDRLLQSSREIVAVFGFSFLNAETRQPFPPSPAHRLGQASRFGIVVDVDSCAPGRIVEPDGKNFGAFIGSDRKRVQRIGVRGYFFCKAVYRPESIIVSPVDPAYEQVFDKIEEACPKVFPPRGVTTCEGAFCWRLYRTTETRITINDQREVNSDHYAAFDNPFLGTVEDLLRDPAQIDCHSDLGKYVPWTPGANMLSRPTKE